MHVLCYCRAFALAVLLSLFQLQAFAAEFTCEVLDAKTGLAIPARVYLQSSAGWQFVRSANEKGSAVQYDLVRAEGRSVEKHTTVSAHPFAADLPAGDYVLTVERGKEYFPTTVQLSVGDQPIKKTVRLRRWIDMASRGWYSGDTHVHRKLGELPNVMLAEDLNVAFPLTGWVTQAFVSPEAQYSKETGRVETELIDVDKTHVIHPLNTEWEIFSVGDKSHTLGAVFAIGHKEPFRIGAPPIRPIAAEARRQNALLELDKHNWPWSMMLVPVMNVDLFELTNNHIWRTQFAFDTWYPEYAADYMNIEMQGGRFTERGWIEFGFQNYYTLLNCGFRMRPTAGTASGVHPVPLGFGRVYVELPDGFQYDKWLEGLNAGRSFVTTGPMMEVKANGQSAGHSFQVDGADPRCHLTGWIRSRRPIERIEVIVNGESRRTPPPAINSATGDSQTANGRFDTPIDIDVELTGSSWIALRCFTRTDDGRTRFAHSSPFFFDVPGKPLRPRKAETGYLIRRIKDEIARHVDVLPAAALEEYQSALGIYEKLHATAR